MTIIHVHTLDPLNVIAILAAIYVASSFVVPFAELIEKRIRAAWDAFKDWKNK